PPRRESARRAQGKASRSSVLLSQPTHAGGRGLPRRSLARAERGADLVVAQVVAVAQDDRRALLGGEVLGQRRKILERRQPVLGRSRLAELGLRPVPARVVD